MKNVPILFLTDSSISFFHLCDVGLFVGLSAVFAQTFFLIHSSLFFGKLVERSLLSARKLGRKLFHFKLLGDTLKFRPEI